MKFGYTILYVKNVPASLRFYSAAFGMTQRFLHEGGDYGELDTGNTTLAFASVTLANSNLSTGIQTADLASKPFASEIAFITSDVSDAYLQATNAGAVSIAAPKLKPWGQTVAYVRDLDGHLIELCTPIN